MKRVSRPARCERPTATRTDARLQRAVRRAGYHDLHEYEGRRDGLLRYRFFDDPDTGGDDAIFGLTEPLTQLVNVFRSAALKYGSERRVLLLHGPVGSSTSTIARLLKKGLESYSKQDAGKCFTYTWRLPKIAGGDDTEQYLDCPMHEEPLLLIPLDARKEVLESINEKLDG